LPTTGNYLQVIYNGPNPGVLLYTGDETEADLDVQWAGAVAKGATVDLVVSQSTETTFGTDLSALYIIDNNLAPIMSESYNGCEAFLGNSGIAFYNTLWEQGAAQGITILVSSGDSGSAGCDYGETAAQYGLAINGISSTPFNVVVGGTDFNDAGSLSTYWSTTNNSTTQSSALSYIPETTWNDSCANTGNLAGCASVASDGSDLVAAGGGPSNCANSTWQSTPEGIEITCNAGIPKPAWQTGAGVPSDGVRHVPDVSLFASNGYNGSFYVICETDYSSLMGGSASSCDLSSPYLDFLGLGGTSAGTPAFAGIMAMVNQKHGRQGNANYVLYPMAAQTGASCASTSLMAPTANASSCIFYDVQVGNNSVACYAGTLNCSNQTASGYGVLVNPSNTTQPAWPTTAGYDSATGLGSVNAYNLVQNWKSNFTPTGTTLCLGTPCATNPITVTHGTPVNFAATVTPAATGDVSLVAPVGSSSSNSTGIGPFPLSSGAVSGSTNMLPGGTYGVTAHYAGNGVDGSSNSPAVQVTVNPESSLTNVQLVTEDCNGNFTYGVTSVQYGYNIVCSGVVYLGYWLRVDVTNSSGNVCYSSTTGIPTYQCPTGQVTVTDNGQPPLDLGAPSGTTPGTYKLNSQGHAEDQFIQLTGGAHNALAARYAGDNSYGSSTGTAAAVTVTQAGTGISVQANNTTVTPNQSVTLTALVSTSSIGFAPSGAVNFVNGVTPMTGTVTYAPADASASGFASLTATLVTSFTTTATITAQYVGDINYSASTSSPLTITVSSGTPDFSVVPSPNTMAIASPGASGTTSIGISPINGFTGTVTLSCAVPTAMTAATCSLASSSITPTTSTILTVKTTAPSTVIGLFNGPRWLAPLGGAVFAAFFLLLIPTKRRRLKLAFGSLFLVLLAAALVACGGGGGGGGNPPPSGGTPAGTYTVTVTGVSGSLTRSANITVTVQ